MKEVPIFLFNGMLESGKTTMVRTLLKNPQLADGRKILILVCEEGIEEYDEAALKEKNASLKIIDKEESFNETLFRKISKEINPDCLIIEYNGMWQPDRFLAVQYPKGYGIAEIMTTVDSTTFNVYLQNMRPMMAAMYRYSDMVVFNRFSGDDNRKISCRSTVKAQNMQAQVAFEYEDGKIDTNFDASPFDLSKDVIEIADTDWGLWYFDAMESVDKYKGKKIKALVRAVRFDGDGKDKGGIMVGRLGMTCCAADQQYLGVICTNDIPGIGEEGWLKITAEVRAADGRMYGEDPEPQLPVLWIVAAEPAKAPENEVVSL